MAMLLFPRWHCFFSSLVEEERRRPFGVHFLSPNRTFEASEMVFGGQKRISKTSEMQFRPQKRISEASEMIF